MTKKTITLQEESRIQRIGASSVLKKGNDLFIVFEIEKEGYADPIEQALFSETPIAGSTYNTPRTMNSVRYSLNKQQGKYALVSFSTGTNFFSKLLTLTELVKLARDNGFEPVKEIEYREL